MRILAICGSLQARSSNLSLLRSAAAAAPPGVEVVVFDGLRDLPHFNPDLELSGVPEAVQRWRRAIADSDALLIASPEYGHSLPGALKNGIADRGRLGLKALRDTLGAVSADVVGGEPITRGPSFEAEVTDLLRRLIDRARVTSTV